MSGMNLPYRVNNLVQRLEDALELAKEEGNCKTLRVNLAYLLDAMVQEAKDEEEMMRKDYSE